jgi:excisionase family DNA binding protein
MGKKLTVVELADRLRVHRDTVYSWVRRGAIPCQRVGQRPILFDVDEVEEAMRQPQKQTQESSA